MAEEWSFFGCTLQDVHSKLGWPCVATLVNGSEYSGYLYNIDPETRTLFVLKRKSPNRPSQQDQVISRGKEPMEAPIGHETKVEAGEAWTMIVVRQHALKTFEFQVDHSSDWLSVEDMDSIARIPHALIDPAKISARKESLVTMLQSKRIPVEWSAEDAVVHIMNSAHVHPPYLPSTVKCANGVILERVKGMIQELEE
ncbi:hypothetical protein BGX34_005542 [Mortierella sp. NVP85]|nr:hypothetical protein BGX34_005542 [Mortierella sp. NVP85]